MMEPSTERWRILLVDDDEDDYILTRAMLDEAKGRQFSLEWAATYKAGQACLLASQYDAVLIDYDLGETNGLNLIREAVEKDYPAALILFTGRGTYEIDLEAMEAGATMYLPKAEATPLLLERFIRYAIERKTAEKNLRLRSQELEAARAEAEHEKRRLEAVFDALPVGVAIIDEAGGLASYNHAFEALWKGPMPSTQSISDYKAYEARWADSGQPLAPEDWASAQAVLNGESVIDQYLEIRRFDGSRASVINSAAPIQNARGATIGCAVAIQDITTLRKIEAALQQSEAEYRHLFEAMDEAVALLQILYDHNDNPSDFVYLNINSAFEELIGVMRGDVIGRKASEAGEPPVDKETLANVAVTGIPARVEVFIPPLNKYLHSAIFSTEHGKVGIVFRDITERKRLQARLYKNEQEMQSVADAAPALLAYIDAGYTYQWMNKGYERWFDRTLVDMQGRKVWEVLGEDAWDGVRGYMQQALAGEQVIYEQKLRFSDGKIRWVRGTYTPDPDADGRVQGFMVHVVDIGQRINAKGRPD